MKKVTYTCTGLMSQVQFSLMFTFVYSTKYNVYNAQCHSYEWLLTYLLIIIEFIDKK